MDFNSFLTDIYKLKELPLGGLESQFKMAPELRKQFSLDDIDKRKPKESAILALFYPNSDQKATILLMLRASYNGTHSAQISFPGGKKDKKDNNLKSTALRETEEEVGIPKKNIVVLRELTKTYIPPSNFWVTPYIGMMETTPTFTTNEEVKKIIEVSVSDLLNENALATKNLTTSYMKSIDVPCFILNDYIVWGATAMMLNEIRDLLKSL